MPVLEGKLLFLWRNRLPVQDPVHPDGAPLLQHIRRSLGVSAFWPVFPVLWPGRRHSPQLDQPAGGKPLISLALPALFWAALLLSLGLVVTPLLDAL